MRKKGILVVVEKEDVKKSPRRQRRKIEFIFDDTSAEMIRAVKEEGGKVLAYKVIEPGADRNIEDAMKVFSALTECSGTGCDFNLAFDYILNLGYDLARKARTLRRPKKAKAKRHVTPRQKSRSRRPMRRTWD